MKTMGVPPPPTAGIGTSPHAGVEPGRTGDAFTSVYPRRRAGVRARAIDAEMVMLDRQRQLVHQLNETASYIWDRCDGEHTVTAIARELTRAFDVGLETAERDVAATVRQLEAVGLVVT